MIKTVLFDFGGVLSETGRQGFIRQVLAELYEVGEDKIDISNLQYQWRKGMTDEDAMFTSLNQLLGKQLTKEDFFARAHQKFVRSKDMYDFVERLRAQGVKTGILSNVFTSTACEMRDRGLYQGFDPIVLSCEEGFAKPDEELYKIAIARCHNQPEEIIFIDDQEKCRPPAEKLGMHFVLAVSAEQAVAETAALLQKLNKVSI